MGKILKTTSLRFVYSINFKQLIILKDKNMKKIILSVAIAAAYFQAFRHKE